MSVRTRILSALTVFIACACTVQSAVQVKKNCRYVREIIVPETYPAGRAHVIIDAAVQAECEGRLETLRILDAIDTIRPYAVRKGHGRSNLRNMDCDVLNLNTDDQGSASMILDLGPTVITHNNVTLSTEPGNFIRRVTVQGGHSPDSWRTLNDEGLIFSVSGGVRTRLSDDTTAAHLRVSYPKCNFRYIKVIIHGGDDPVELLGGVIQHLTKSYAEYTNVKITRTVAPTEPQPGSVQRFIFDLGTPGVSTGRMQFVTSNSGFYRDVRVRSGESVDFMSEIHTDHIFRYVQGTALAETLTIDFPETTHRYVGVDIVNNDDDPLNIEEIRFAGIARYLYFECKPREILKLYYGGNHVSAPAYDFERTHRNLQPRANRLLRLGPKQENPEFNRNFFDLFSGIGPYLLWSVLIVAVAAISFIGVKSIHE